MIPPLADPFTGRETNMSFPQASELRELLVTPPPAGRHLPGAASGSEPVRPRACVLVSSGSRPGVVAARNRHRSAPRLGGLSRLATMR